MEPDDVVDTKESNDNIFFIRLVTGEDIISIIEEGESMEEDEPPQYLRLIYPQKVVYSIRSDDSEKLNIQLHQWIFSYLSDKQNFDICNHDILTIAEPSPEFKIDYLDCVKKQLERAEKALGAFKPDDDDEQMIVEEGKPGEMLKMFEEHTQRGNRTLH